MRLTHAVSQLAFVVLVPPSVCSIVQEPPMPFEYRIVPADDLTAAPTVTRSTLWKRVYAADVEQALNDMAESGWELAATFAHADSGAMFVFRREWREPPRIVETGIKPADR
jgi:hypothetical protein